MSNVVCLCEIVKFFFPSKLDKILAKIHCKTSVRGIPAQIDESRKESPEKRSPKKWSSENLWINFIGILWLDKLLMLFKATNLKRFPGTFFEDFFSAYPNRSSRDQNYFWFFFHVICCRASKQNTVDEVLDFLKNILGPIPPKITQNTENHTVGRHGFRQKFGQ